MSTLPYNEWDDPEFLKQYQAMSEDLHRHKGVTFLADYRKHGKALYEPVDGDAARPGPPEYIEE
jgi:hypothetical protein